MDSTNMNRRSVVLVGASYKATREEINKNNCKNQQISRTFLPKIFTENLGCCLSARTCTKSLRSKVNLFSIKDDLMDRAKV